MTDQLKTCPFCGEEGNYKLDHGWHGVGCQTNRCPGYRFALQHRTKDEAVEAWNNRGTEAGPTSAPHFDMLAHLRRQAEFSARTFGPGARVDGVTEHIAKELVEVRDSGGDLAEWIDVVILALDGCWRSGASPEQIITALVAKQTKNEGRTWPDWRTAPAGKAIEHDRTADRP